MSDPSDPSPPGQRSSLPPAHPMSVLAAVAWSLGTTFVFVLLLSLVVSARPSASTDLVSAFACQSIAYLLALFLILRLHAPDASIRAFLGLRATHVAFYPLAVIVGVALEPGMDALYTLIERAHPSKSPDTFLEAFRDASTPKRAALGLIVVALGPILEEVLFRGAIWKPLSRTYGGNLRVIVPVTAALFAFAHTHWQMHLPIVMIGLALALLRYASGSLVPSMLLHMAFNFVPFMLTVTSQAPAPDAPLVMPPLPLVAGSAVVAIAALGLVYLVGARSAVAARARELDR